MILKRVIRHSIEQINFDASHVQILIFTEEMPTKGGEFMEDIPS